MRSGPCFITRAFLAVVVGSAPGLVSHADAQWYVSGSAGLAAAAKSEMTNTGQSGSSTTGDVSFKPGFAVTAVVGRSWNALRVDGEVFYRSNGLSEFEATNVAGGGPVFGGLSGTLGGDATAIGFMLSGWYDFRARAGWVPYVGGGLGISRATLRVTSVAGEASFPFDASGTAFSFQAGAGIVRALTARTSLALSYRLFSVPNAEFATAATDGFQATNIEGGFVTHVLAAGVVVRF